MQGDGVLSEGLPCIKGNTCCHNQRNRVGVSERYTVHQSQKARSINIIHTSIHPHSPSNHQTQPSIHSIPSYPSRPNHQSHPSIPRPFSPIHTSIRPLIHPIHPPIPSHLIHPIRGNPHPHPHHLPTQPHRHPPPHSGKYLVAHRSKMSMGATSHWQSSSRVGDHIPSKH